MGRTCAGFNLLCETAERKKHEVIQCQLMHSESQNTSCFDVLRFDCDQLKSSVVSPAHPFKLIVMDAV